VSEQIYSDVKQQVVKAKDMNERKFKYLSDNFYVVRSALRYFSVKQGRPLTSSKLSDNFPLTAPIAGSCLDMLDQLDVVEKRTESNSPHVYMPEKVDMVRLESVEQVLKDNYEINEYY
jgi:hypothetical protein